MKIFWTKEQDALMLKHYANSSMNQLKELLGRSECSIYNRAFILGLKKSQEYLDSPAACRLRRGDNIGAEYRFKKGQIPFNKGVKGINYEGCKATQFTKGNKPANYRPIGTIRIQADGYYEMKMAEGLHQWRLLHRVVWERLNGKIPRGMNLVFIDKNKQNIKITNLSLVTKAQNMQRNSLHNYPKEIATLIQLQGAINRQINRKAKQNEQYRHA